MVQNGMAADRIEATDRLDARTKTLRDAYSAHEGKVSDKWSFYLKEYDRLFEGLRDKAIRLLEIGVQNGGSLEIWAAHFPKAKVILGCDSDPRCKELTFSDNKIALIVGDANSDDVEREIASHTQNFDIVIDDGSHRSSDIVRSFSSYFKHVADGGLYIIEDLHCSYWADYEGGLYDPYSSISFFKRLLDVINREHWGIPRGRTDALAAFAGKYSVAFDEQALSSIHSIEFLNSLCVVRKAEPGENELGPRRIVGRDAAVYNPLISDGTLSKPSDQTMNPWSLDQITMEEEIEANRHLVRQQRETIDTLSRTLAEAREQNHGYEVAIAEERARLAATAKELGALTAEVRKKMAEWAEQKAKFGEERSELMRLAEERAAEIERHRFLIGQIHASTSWRITAPMRFLRRQLRRISGG